MADTFKKGDLVKILEQPDNQHVRIKGLVGFIDEVDGEWCNVETLGPDGMVTGGGTVPTSCLVHHTSEELKRRKQVWDDHLAALRENCKRREDLWKRKVRALSKEHGIAEENVEDIYRQLGNLRETW